MAKAKKNEALSLEERLEQALVSVEEQPYEVPENWCWTRIREICEFERGITFPASAKEHDLTEDNIACLRTANIQEELEVEDLLYVNKSYMKGNVAKLVKKDDIIMSSANSRELVGKASYVHDVNEPMTFGGFVLNIRAKKVLSKYLFYMLRFEFLSGKFMGESTQTTNIANINTTTLGNYCFPLPPLAEQQRIVEQIESLFAKLDEAKDKVQDALDSFEGRKNAILYKALSGAYTRAWRDENNISLDDWNEYTIEEICANIVDCPHTTPEWTEEGILCLRTTNIKLGYFDFTETQYVSDDTYHERTERLVPQEGDLIFTREGSVGDVAIVPANTKLCLGQRMMLMRTSERCLPEYLLFFLISPFIRNYIKENIMGTTAPRMNIKDIKKFKIHVPPVEEQEEIIKVIKPLLQNDADSKELADIRYSIDMLKKSILGKAFRGELGTNDSSEENSIELLKVIMKE